MTCHDIPVIRVHRFWGTSWSFVIGYNSVDPVTGAKIPVDASNYVFSCGFDTTYDNNGTTYVIDPADVSVVGGNGQIVVTVTNPTKTKVSYGKVVGDIRYKTMTTSPAENILCRLEVTVDSVVTTSL